MSWVKETLSPATKPRHRLIAALLIGSLLAACGGGNSDSQALDDGVLTISFPFAHASFDGSTITVTGNLEHREPSRFSVIANAGEADVSGSVDEDGRFVVAQVPIDTGSDETVITVTATHDGGGSTRETIRLSREPAILTLDSLAMDADGERVIAIDSHSSLVSFDFQDGHRKTISGPDRGAGESLDGSSALAVDSANGVAYIGQGYGDTVILRIDLETGDRTLVSGAGRGEGPALSFANHLAFDSATGSVLVADNENRTLVWVDTVTGDRSVLTAYSSGPDAMPGSTTALALDVDYRRALVLYVGEIFAVDLVTGESSFLAQPVDDSGLPIEWLSELTVEDGFAYVADRNLRTVARVDLTSGDTEILSVDEDIPEEVCCTVVFSNTYTPPASIAVNDGRVLLTDGTTASLIGVDAATGGRDVLFDGLVGDGVRLLFATGLAMGTDPVELYGIDPVGELAVQFNLADGDRTTLVDSFPPVTPEPAALSGLDAGADIDDATDIFYMPDPTQLALLGLDLRDGSVRIVSGPEIGSGPSFGHVLDVTVDSIAQTAYVLDEGWQTYNGPPPLPAPPESYAIIAVDLTTGDRTIVSGDDWGEGDAFDSPTALDLDIDHGRVFVPDVLPAGQVIMAVDLRTGDRTTFVDLTEADLFQSGWLLDIDYDPRQERFLGIQSYDTLYRIDARTGEWDVVSGSLRRAEDSTDSNAGDVTAASETDSVVGGGPLFGIPTRLVFDEPLSVVFVIDGFYRGLLAIELESGDRQLISR